MEKDNQKERVSLALRISYERALGCEVSDRTWYRVKDRLGIEDESDMAYLPLVEAYAILRKKNPTRGVTLADTKRYQFLSQNLPNATCNGLDLYESLCRLEPKPSDTTLYKWGRQIKCPLRKDANTWYQPEQLKKWVMKIIEQTQFEFKEKANG